MVIRVRNVLSVAIVWAAAIRFMRFLPAFLWFIRTAIAITDNRHHWRVGVRERDGRVPIPVPGIPNIGRVRAAVGAALRTTGLGDWRGRVVSVTTATIVVVIAIIPTSCRDLHCLAGW